MHAEPERLHARLAGECMEEEDLSGEAALVGQGGVRPGDGPPERQGARALGAQREAQGRRENPLPALDPQ